jgi:hypothetical protein
MVGKLLSQKVPRSWQLQMYFRDTRILEVCIKKTSILYHHLLHWYLIYLYFTFCREFQCLKITYSTFDLNKSVQMFCENSYKNLTTLLSQSCGMKHNLKNIFLLFTCYFTVMAHNISEQFALKIYKIKHKHKT